MKSKSFKLYMTIIYIISLILLTIISLPLIRAFISGNADEFISFINSFGTLGFIIMMFIQIAQVVVALIPGELVEFAAGTLYGAFPGLLFCLAGTFIGQSIIFICARLIGKDFVRDGAAGKIMTKYEFLQSESRLKTLCFFLYFIPGTPKDLLAYVFPLTSIRFLDFTVISLIARIPSIISSTLGGSAFAEENFLKMFIIYAAIAIMTLLGWIIYKKTEKK